MLPIHWNNRTQSLIFWMGQRSDGKVSRKPDFNVICPFLVRFLVPSSHPWCTSCSPWHWMSFIFTSYVVRMVMNRKSVMVQIIILNNEEMVVERCQWGGITELRRQWGCTEWLYDLRQSSNYSKCILHTCLQIEVYLETWKC